LKKRSKKLLFDGGRAGGRGGGDPVADQHPDEPSPQAKEKGFLLLFFKKEALPYLYLLSKEPFPAPSYGGISTLNSRA
jgi:hypothetical protein